MAEPHLTERQRKWFASIRDGLERDTGRSLEAWVEIARDCPETGHRARLKWFKETHGLLQNRASYVLSEAFEPTMAWSETDALVESLWTDPASRAIYEAIDALAMALDGAIRTPRKGYTAWARRFQFAAARPVKGGRALLGLATPQAADPRLEPRGNQSWSERLTARLTLDHPTQVDHQVRALITTAWNGA
jgi:hypothetical protein